MSALDIGTPPELAGLRAGLAFASEARRPVIQAMIDDLLSRANAGDSVAAAAVPQRETIRLVGSPAGGRRQSSPQGEDANVSAGVTAGETATPDWRGARRALRARGHEVKQLDGVVYVDGRRDDDPALAGQA